MRVKNTSTEKTYCGQTLATNQEYDIQSTELTRWQSDDSVVADLSTGLLLVGDGNTYQTAGAQAVNYLLGTGIKEVSVQVQPPFSSKVIGTKKLYIRATGKAHPVTVGSNNLDFLVPYNVMKFNGIQIVNCELGETVNLKVLDSATGAYSTFPNYMLNQFGFTINLPNGVFIKESQYDADVYKDMVIRIEYTAVTARDVRINYSIHELK